MKNALVLGGGGSRGAYQIGAIIALNELGYKFHVVTGTSVGALNASLLAVNKLNLLKEIWEKIDYNTIIEHKYKFKNRTLETLIKAPLKGGFSVAPLEELLQKHLNVEELKKSEIKIGIVYTRPFKKYASVKLQEIDENKIIDYIVTSCSAYPFLKKRKIEGKKCYDGYFSDNVPVKLAKEMGANKIIAIDIMKGLRKKVDTKDIQYFYLKPSKKLGFFLNFDSDSIKKMMELGYHDVMNYKESILEFINK